MDRKRVQFLEEEIGAAIAEVLGRSDVDDMPNEQIMHLMAKAAVTVLEAVEIQDDGR
jgi:hypothetical protein